MPELGASKRDLHAIVLAKLDEYLGAVTEENKRAAALAMRAALASWTSPKLTEDITEAAQAMLVAEGHGDQRQNFRLGAAWCEVIPWINALAHPEAHPTWPKDSVGVCAKLDTYITLLADENKRAAALVMRNSLIDWTSPDLPEAVTQAARAMLVAEDYAAFQAQLLKMTSLPKRQA